MKESSLPSINEYSILGFFGLSPSRGFSLGGGFSRGTTTGPFGSFGGGFFWSSVFWADIPIVSPMTTANVNSTCFNVFISVTSSFLLYITHPGKRESASLIFKAIPVPQTYVRRICTDLSWKVLFPCIKALYKTLRFRSLSYEIVNLPTLERPIRSF
jgi:hypothetical protein